MPAEPQPGAQPLSGSARSAGAAIGSRPHDQLSMTGDESARSLYDGGDDEEDAPWFLRPKDADDEEDAPPGRAFLSDWREAERDHLRLLADTARLHGRLEQALALQGGAARLALIEASDLLWLEGVRIRPERLWMFRADREAGPVADRAEYVLGLWAVERLLGDWHLADDEGLARFLGRRLRDQDPSDQTGLALPSSEHGLTARADWLAAREASAGLHPLTQAAYLADLWRQAGPGGRDKDTEAAVIAARIGARIDGGDGLPFAPLAFGAKRRIGGAGGVPARLTQFLEAAHGGAQRALLELGRMADWRARAAAAPLKKNPAALIGLLDAEFAITTGRAEAYLGSSRQTALTSLNILRTHGLAREITGAKSFFYWTADLNPLVRPQREIARG